MSRFQWVAIIAILLLAGQASATPILTVGDYNLNANQANQAVSVYVSGGDAVSGLNFYLQVGDGTAGPLIQSIDLLTGTIFASNNTGQSSAKIGGSLPYWNYGKTVFTTIDDNGQTTVGANGLLATVKIDTTGLSAGTWTLKADFEYGGDSYTSDFAGTPATIVNGSIHIVPEPGTLALLVVGLAGLVAWRRWR